MILIGGYEIDVAVTETYSRSADPTPHPVEEGAEVTDHVITRPLSISLSCIVSDTPIGDLATRRQASGLLVGGLEGGFVPSDDAHRFLNELMDSREPFTYQGSRGTFDNMVITNLSEPHSARTGDSLRFEAVLQQILIVQTERTTVRVATPRSRRRQNVGTKPTNAFEGTVAAPLVDLVQNDANQIRRLIPF